ncbi:hypothetical protein Hanom_Chr09g00837021 [Helianthus anomalus]
MISDCQKYAYNMTPFFFTLNLVFLWCIKNKSIIIIMIKFQFVMRTTSKAIQTDRQHSNPPYSGMISVSALCMN